MMEAVDELSRETGIRRAADALGVPRASHYRSFKKEKKSPAERSVPKRALGEAERDEVKDQLYSDRFCDKAPREVYAALLDEGRYRGCPEAPYFLRLSQRPRKTSEDDKPGRISLCDRQAEDKRREENETSQIATSPGVQVIDESGKKLADVVSPGEAQGGHAARGNALII